MRDGFCRRNHDPPLKCSDSSRRSTSLFCGRYGVEKGRSPSGGLISGPLAASWGLSALFSLLSSLSALFPLLSLPLISQIALRTCPFDLCIRPSTSPPTAATLCGTIPGPAECAKRLNPPSPWRRAGSSALIYNLFISLTPPIILPGGPAHSAGQPRGNLF